jgi:hypothetical protein
MAKIWPSRRCNWSSRRNNKDQMIRPLGFTFYFVVVVVVRIDVSQIKAF